MTKKYAEWVQQAGLPPLTGTQAKFAEWLLIKDNAAIISQIGDLETIFSSVRKYLKDAAKSDKHILITQK